MQAAAASQPNSETLPPVAAADVAAFAHIVGETEAAKKLFCRGAYTLGEPAAPEPAAPVFTASATNALAPQPAAASAAAEPAHAEPAIVTVPLPPARPSALRR
jgi:hypothetical protein